MSWLWRLAKKKAAWAVIGVAAAALGVTISPEVRDGISVVIEALAELIELGGED